MFNLDEKYKLNKSFKASDFITKELAKGDKKRIKEVIKSAVLMYQIKGEEIPSLIDDTYNYQVIMFFEIELDKLKNAVFVNNILQKQIKAPCVIKFCDNISCCYGFANKRLNMVTDNEVVFDNVCISALFSKSDKMDNRLNIENLKNKSNKKTLYTELMVKTYILSNLKLVGNITSVFDTDIWYNEKKKTDFFNMLLELQLLRQKKARTNMPKEKVEINTKMKEVIDNIKSYYEVSAIE